MARPTKSMYAQVTDPINAQADALFLSIGEGAITTDEEGNISRINQAALSILGLKEEDVVGKWFPGVIVAVDEDGKKIEPIHRPITRAIMRGKTISERAFYRDVNGRSIPVLLTVSPIIMNNKPIGAVEVFRDISREYEIDQLKSEFISIASHQLRTPATAVKNFIGLLREGYAGELTDEQSQLIEQAYISNELQLEIVNNLLYAARADNNQVRLKLTRCNLVELLQECIAEQKDTIHKRGQHLIVQLPIKNITTTMDRQFIRMMVENLLSNASKYTPDGGSLSLTLDEAKYFITLTVADTGVGIGAGDLVKLFQRFSRIDNELSTVRGGSGIGLYLVKRIADLHNYQVNVESEKGRGSKFSVVIPKERSNAHN